MGNGQTVGVGLHHLISKYKDRLQINNVQSPECDFNQGF